MIAGSKTIPLNNEIPPAVPSRVVLKIDLNRSNGIDMRREVNDHVEDNWDKLRSSYGMTRGASEETRKMEIKKGYLAQYVIRKCVGLTGIDPDDIDYSADLTSPHGIKIDVKSEGIKFDFQEIYEGTGGVPREAKHNFYPRQLFDHNLESTDLFVVTRIQTGDMFPGSGQRSEKRWNLWICGWVSKKRVIREGILIPRGGITEQGQKFFAYRSHNVEFYQYALNPVNDLAHWFDGITRDDVHHDETKHPDDTRQCTTADAQRIMDDLLAKGVIERGQFEKIGRAINPEGKHVPSILHDNHTVRFVRHLVRQGQLPPAILQRLGQVNIRETRPENLDELKRFFE